MGISGDEMHPQGCDGIGDEFHPMKFVPWAGMGLGRDGIPGDDHPHLKTIKLRIFYSSALKTFTWKFLSCPEEGKF